MIHTIYLIIVNNCQAYIRHTLAFCNKKRVGIALGNNEVKKRWALIQIHSYHTHKGYGNPDTTLEDGLL